ncbi:uncharacterized protein LOC132706371 isoform X2 [Cylas formicarius]|uniref:uncharacterized protein LOC132706371 isoform X2 n=1 Tax=Cylas formicarius TaxID=197179 RepID=UPI00295885CB|nr:uncharacterized protein LOC132706371 isoform X2 [Cylas formicarius]
MSCFKRVCRLCLTRTDDYTSVFVAVEPLGLPITALLKAFLPDLYTGLSVNPVVCKNCLIQLKNTYLFRLKCLQTENLIGIYLRESRCTALCINLEDVLYYWSKNDSKLNKSGQDLLSEPTPMSSVDGKIVLNSKVFSLINMDLTERAKDALTKNVKTYEKNKSGNKPIAKPDKNSVPDLQKDPLEITIEKSPESLPVEKNLQSDLKEIVVNSKLEGNLKEVTNSLPSKETCEVASNGESNDSATGKAGQKLSDEVPKERIRIRSDLELKSVRTLNHELYPQPQVPDKGIPLKVIIKPSPALMKEQPKVLNFRQFTPVRRYKKILPRKPVENLIGPEPKVQLESDLAANEKSTHLGEGQGDYIKEEPLRGSENELSCSTPSDEDTTSASESYMCENILEENSKNGVQDIIDKIPEVSEDAVDVPDYVQINKISYEDLAKMCKENKLHSLPRKDEKVKMLPAHRMSRRWPRKRLRLVAVDAKELQDIKKKKLGAVPLKAKQQILSADDEKHVSSKDVVVLYTNLSKDGDYVSDHDYLISPYRRNNLFFPRWNKCFCLCLLCGKMQTEVEHKEHMMGHSTVCDVCGVDYHNAFILNLHAKCHKIFCTDCNEDIPYGKYKKHCLNHHSKAVKKAESSLNASDSGKGNSIDPKESSVAGSFKSTDSGKIPTLRKYENTAKKRRRSAPQKEASGDESKGEDDQEDEEAGKPVKRSKMKTKGREKNKKLKSRAGEEESEDEECLPGQYRATKSLYRRRTLRSRAKASASSDDLQFPRRRSPRCSK